MQQPVGDMPRLEDIEMALGNGTREEYPCAYRLAQGPNPLATAPSVGEAMWEVQSSFPRTSGCSALVVDTQRCLSIGLGFDSIAGRLGRLGGFLGEAID